MPDFWKRVSAPVVIAGLAILATVTMVSDRRSLAKGGSDLPWWQSWVMEIAIPLQKVAAVPADAVRGVWWRYVDLVGVREENADLRRRIDGLEDENLQYREALVASGHLERVAAMRDDFEVPMLPSEVVGLDVSPWFRSVLIDRGTQHGVSSGYPVVTDRGLVGVVTATSAHAARTMLVLDRQSAVDVLVQRSRTRGVVRGRGTGELQLEFVVREADVRAGDVVVTSGMGGVYPKGLRVGEVTEVLDAEGDLLQTARVRPAVDFGRVEHVFLMLRRGPTMELLYGPSAPATARGAPSQPPSKS